MAKNHHAPGGPVRLLIAVTCLLALLPATSANAAPRQVPQGFMSMFADGPAVDANVVDVDAQVGAMARNGVESLRVAFHWREMQPYASAADVPVEEQGRFPHSVDGVPTDFAHTDRLVAAASAHGIKILPVVLFTPSWAAKDPSKYTSPPADVQTYARFMGGLVRRYGPGGEFARERGQATLPVRSWQVWNEPNVLAYWSEQPFARSYVRLLKAAAMAIRKADPGAQVVLAGLVNRSWNHIRKVYAEGGRRFFDIAAIHPFTREPKNVLRILRLVRRAMADNRDRRKHMIVTEVTYASAAGKGVSLSFGIEVTEKEQADRLEKVYTLLAARRRELLLDRVYWASWLRYDKSGDDVFDYSGLRSVGPDGAIRDKPALGAYRRVARRLEGCAKNSVARCR